jgi:hypothetical protein
VPDFHINHVELLDFAIRELVSKLSSVEGIHRSVQSGRKQFSCSNMEIIVICGIHRILVYIFLVSFSLLSGSFNFFFQFCVVSH